MKFYKHLIILLIIIVTTLCGWNVYRFTPQYPMPDIEYKKAIVRDSHNITYTVEALRPIMGPNELSEFIKNNDNNPSVYTPSNDNIKKGVFRANLHTHTTNSDGASTVEGRMLMAQEYAAQNIKDGYMLLAITDHNTVLGAKNVVEVLEHNKGKFDKIRVIPGIEIFTEYHRSSYSDEPIQIHVLTWCINPFDKYLDKEFYKKNLNDKWNRKSPERDFDTVISTMSNYGIVGVAHPARYTSDLKDKKYPYITEMLTRYSKLTKNTPFTEGYYQSYKATSTGEHLGKEYDKYIKYINSEAKRLNIVRTGSTDAHGFSIFKYRD